MKPNTATMTNGPSATHRPPRVQETPRYPVHVRLTFVRVARPTDATATRYGKIGAE